jgi:hypothetical protein
MFTHASDRNSVRRVIIRLLDPREPTDSSTGSSVATRRRSRSRGFETCHDEVLREGGELVGCRVEPREVGFEGALIRVAGGVAREWWRGLAGGLTHDVGRAVVAVEEGLIGGVEQQVGFVIPGSHFGSIGEVLLLLVEDRQRWGGGAYAVVVVHVRGTGEEDTRVVGPLDFGGNGTLGEVRAVVDLVVTGDQTVFFNPSPCFLRPFGVGAVSRVPCQTRAHLEEQSVGDRVLVVVTLVGGGDLPAQTSVTRSRVPSRRLSVEHGLRKSEPLRLVRWRIRVATLGSGHRRDSPERLIVVTQRKGLVRRLVIVIRADLE